MANETAERGQNAEWKMDTYTGHGLPSYHLHVEGQERPVAAIEQIHERVKPSGLTDYKWATQNGAGQTSVHESRFAAMQQAREAATTNDPSLHLSAGVIRQEAEMGQREIGYNPRVDRDALAISVGHGPAQELTRETLRIKPIERERPDDYGMGMSR